MCAQVLYRHIKKMYPCALTKSSTSLDCPFKTLLVEAQELKSYRTILNYDKSFEMLDWIDICNVEMLNS